MYSMIVTRCTRVYLNMDLSGSNHGNHKETRPLPWCNTDKVYSPMTDLSQSVLGFLSST